MLREDEKNIENIKEAEQAREKLLQNRFQSNPIKRKLLEFSKEKGFKPKDLFR